MSNKRNSSRSTGGFRARSRSHRSASEVDTGVRESEVRDSRRSSAREEYGSYDPAASHEKRSKRDRQSSSEQRENRSSREHRRGRGEAQERGANRRDNHDGRRDSRQSARRGGEEHRNHVKDEEPKVTATGEPIFTERTPRVVNAAKLKRSAVRKKEKRFLVEGENSVEAAVATGAATDIFLTKSAAARFTDIVAAAKAMGMYVHFIDEKAAKSLQDTVTSTGIFAVCREVLWSARDVLNGRPKLVSVPVETNEPGNAGTLIRVADAMGADCVLFAGDTVDPQSGKAARSSAGSLFHIPVARERNIMKVVSMLRERGLAIAATAADGEVDLTDAEDLLSQPTAWLFGNEAHGLPEELQAQADYRVRIPIRGRAESLNLATAASICLFESSKYQAKAAESARSGQISEEDVPEAAESDELSIAEPDEFSAAEAGELSAGNREAESDDLSVDGNVLDGCESDTSGSEDI